MDSLLQQDPWLASDESIGPGNDRIFDFTLVFENAILSILPAAFLLLIAPIHVWKYSRGPKVASAGSFYWARLAVAVSMLTVEVARSVVWCRSRFPDSSLPALSGTSLASAVLGPLSALGYLVMMHIEYFYERRSSSILGMSLFVSLLFESARTRSFWIRPSFVTVGQLSLAIVCLQIVFLVLQEVPKPLDGDASFDSKWFGEAKGGFFNRLFLFWLNRLMLLGYRTKLTLASLGTLGPEFSAEALATRLETNWNSMDQKPKHALAHALFKTFKWSFLGAVIPQYLEFLSKFTLPLMIQRILIFMASPDREPPVAAALLGASIISYILSGMSWGSTQYYMNRFTAYLRASLVVLLVKKDLRLGVSEAKKAASVGLMTADIESIVQAFTYICEIFTMAPDIALALYLLWRIIGKAFFLTLLQLAAFWVVSWYIGRMNGQAFSKWNKAIQLRVSEATAAIAQMKGIRIMGLDQAVSGYLHSLRANEVRESRTARLLRILFVDMYILQMWSSYVILLAGGLFWTVWKDGLDPVTLWPAVSYNFILGSSFYTIVEVYPSIMALLACINRIQDFLNSSEPEDSREIAAMPSSDPMTTSEKNGSEKEHSPAIKFRSVCVQAKDDGHLALDDASFEVSTSALVFVIGAVGSGKSVLLKTIMGEAQLSSGTIQLATARLGYCDQIPWLPYMSIRDAIVGETPWDEIRYKEVLDACALQHDIGRFPSGDATMVGANGSGLSGGQKQRISLARAVYSLAPIVVCDDILSALDSETAATVFRDIFSSSGILKRQGRTAVVATHSVQWLSTADQVLVIDQGKVSILTDEEETTRYAETAVISSQHSVEDEDAVPEALDNVKAELEFARASQGTRATEIGLYATMLQAVPRLIVIAVFVSCASIALIESFPPIYLRLWMQQDATNNLYLIGMGVLTVVAVAVFNGGNWLYQMIVMPTVSMSLHDVFVEKVMSATLSFITSTNSGVLLNRFSQDMTLIGQELPTALYGTVCSACNSVIAILVIASSAQYATICIPVSLFMMWVVQHYYLRTSRQIRLLDLESKTPLYAKMSETQRGVETIRGLGWQEQTIKKSIQLVDDSQVPYYYMFIIQRWLYVVLALLGCGVASVLSAMALYLTDTASQASIGFGLTNINHFTMATVKFIQRFTKLETSLGAIARLKTFIEETPSESDEGREPPPAHWPSQGAIEFTNVSARYTSEGDATALSDVSLQIEAGEKVVIVGRTGSGKSTMLLTLLNFLDMTGSITIDGVDISTIPRQQLRSRLTTLPQDSIEIFGSVYDDLLPFEKKTFQELKKSKPEKNKSANPDIATVESRDKDQIAELESVLEKVHLLDIIKKKGGVDAVTKDLHLSSGQRQLFNLARAILHKRRTGSKIVLMDEVTSNMDFETDRTMQELLDTEFGDCTRIIISHRTTERTKYDKLVTMREGKIVSVKETKRVEAPTEITPAAMSIKE